MYRFNNKIPLIKLSVLSYNSPFMWSHLVQSVSLFISLFIREYNHRTYVESRIFPPVLDCQVKLIQIITMSADSTAQKEGYYIQACNDESVKNKSTARLVTWTFTKKKTTWFVLTFTDFYQKKPWFVLTFTILRILTIYFHDVQWWSVVDALKVIKNYHLRLNLTTSMGFSSTNGNCRHKISSFSGVL